jgi:3-hydroxy-9,10-secoandrosta-1,3,5(10)-triene-9,17-dione monooxygenase reductase component
MLDGSVRRAGPPARRQGRQAGLSADALKAVFGTFVTGVVIVTTNGPTGMTCQTFCPVSLDPPLVSVAVSRHSGAGERLRSEGMVCFNILDRSGAELARRFATRGIDRFADLEWSASPALGLPLLSQTIGWVDGVVEDVITAGDHFLLVARVVGMGSTQCDAPLAYFRGQFLGVTGPDGAVAACRAACHEDEALAS